MAKIICNLSGAASVINGINFYRSTGGSFMSEDITEERARQFLGLPNYAVIGDSGQVMHHSSTHSYAGSGDIGVIDGVLRERSNGEAVIPNLDTGLNYEYNAEGQRIDRDGLVVKNIDGDIITRTDDERNVVNDNEGQRTDANGNVVLDDPEVVNDPNVVKTPRKNKL